MSPTRRPRKRCAELILPPLYSTGHTMKRWHNGRPCRRWAAEGSDYCWQHRVWHDGRGVTR